jgi:hypothetical protein
MSTDVINLRAKLGKFSDYQAPRCSLSRAASSTRGQRAAR